MIAASVVLDLIKQGLFINFARKASINLHNQMIEKLTTAVMSFYDNYFIGNILNRFSQDLTKIDEHLPHTINHFTRVSKFGLSVVEKFSNNLLVSFDAVSLIVQFQSCRLQRLTYMDSFRFRFVSNNFQFYKLFETH